MTDNDEETKEHPIYPEAPAPAAPMTVDPLEPTTTIKVSPALPPAPPTYPQPPSQGWPGQPSGPPNFPSGQDPWQSTGYGQTGYGPPPGYGAQQPWAAAAPAHRTSVLVVLAALILVVFGVAFAVLGAWLLTQGSALNDLIQRVRGVDLFVFKPTRDQLKMAFSASPGVFMVLALIGLLLSVVTLVSAMALVPGLSVELMVAVVLLLGYAYVVLALIAGGGHFRARSQGR